MLNKFLSFPLVRVAFRYGTLSGVLVMVFVVSMYYMDMHPFLVNPFVDPRVPALAILLFFGLRDFRDNDQAGLLFFGQSMVLSFLVTLVCASFCWAGIVAFAALDPGFVSGFIQLATEQTRSFSPEDIERIGKETFQQSLDELRRADGYFMAGRYFFQTFIISFFVSLILSVILRRTPQEKPE